MKGMLAVIIIIIINHENPTQHNNWSSKHIGVRQVQCRGKRAASNTLNRKEHLIVRSSKGAATFSLLMIVY